MRKFAIGFLIAGISMITLSLGLTAYSTYTYNKLLPDSIEKQTDSEFLKASLESSKSDIEKDIIPQNAIGIIKIPSIDLKFPIMSGVEDTILRQAVGHFKESSGLGETGNATLIGHNNFILAEPFKNLNSVPIGESVEIVTPKGIFNYIFTSKRVTNSNDTSILDISETPILTLITCTDNAKERLVYQATLDTHYNEKNETPII